MDACACPASVTMCHHSRTHTHGHPPTHPCPAAPRRRTPAPLPSQSRPPGPTRTPAARAGEGRGGQARGSRGRLAAGTAGRADPRLGGLEAAWVRRTQGAGGVQACRAATARPPVYGHVACVSHCASPVATTALAEHASQVSPVKVGTAPPSAPAAATSFPPSSMKHVAVPAPLPHSTSSVESPTMSMSRGSEGREWHMGMGTLWQRGQRSEQRALRVASVRHVSQQH